MTNDRLQRTDESVLFPGTCVRMRKKRYFDFLTVDNYENPHGCGGDFLEKG